MIKHKFTVIFSDYFLVVQCFSASAHIRLLSVLLLMDTCKVCLLNQ